MSAGRLSRLASCADLVNGADARRDRVMDGDYLRWRNIRRSRSQS